MATAKLRGYFALKSTVQLRGNVALARYSTLESRDLDTPYSCSDAPDASTSRVVITQEVIRSRNIQGSLFELSIICI